MTQDETAKIRDFLSKRFDDSELMTLCFDYFRDTVYREFTAGMPLSQKILMLLDYCHRHGTWNILLAALERERPEQYIEAFPKPTPVQTLPAYMPRNPREVFISHAHEDSDFAHRLANDLVAQGWPVWIAPDSIQPGEKWVEAINRGLAESGVFLLVLTPKAVASRWVKFETAIAIELNQEGEIHLIPLQVEPCQVPPVWRPFQHISFRGRYEAGFRALIGALERKEVNNEQYPVTSTQYPVVRSGERPQQGKEVASGDTPSSKVERSAVSPDTAPGSKVSPDAVAVPTTKVVTPNSYVDAKTGTVMVRVPAGEFLYGGQKEKMSLPEFWISKMPVTNAEYHKFIQENAKHPVPKHWDAQKRTYPPNKANHPVVYVSGHDAQAYAKWAGKRLPTEQEWEKAARGTDGRQYPWGDNPPTAELCNFGKNVGDTTPVGKYSPQRDSPYGCVDMSGNVWEWTDSWYSD